jgi:5-methylcytosine-specific restriction endonuclease McrA
MELKVQPRAIMNCLQCSLEFQPLQKNTRFCSPYCGKRFYYLANKQRLDAYRSLWSKSNSGKQVEYVRKCRDAKPDKYRALRRRAENTRRARLGGGGTHTIEEWHQLLRDTGNRCLRCGVSGKKVSLTVDHILPVSMGGTDSIDNIQPLCKPCNSAKHARVIDYRRAA